MWGILDSYFGQTFYLILLVIIILCFWKERQFIYTKKILIALSIFGMGFPIVYCVFVKFRQISSFYRILWLLPLSIILPIGCVWILKKIRNRGKIGGIICIFAVLFGSGYWFNCDMELPDNIYKLDSDVIKAAEMIENDKKTEYVKVVGEVSFMRQVRQYSARLIWGYANRNCMMEAPAGDMKDINLRVASAIQSEIYSEGVDIYTDLEQLEADYVVIYQDKQLVDHLPQGSYDIIGETEQYQVVKMNYDIQN